jgi:hypothetical protein
MSRHRKTENFTVRVKLERQPRESSKIEAGQIADVGAVDDVRLW